MTNEPLKRIDTTSAPSVTDVHTGSGSVSAIIISKGGFASRFTPQGAIRPFGEDMGTADDDTVIAHYRTDETPP